VQRMRRTYLVVVPILAVLIVGAACGSDNKKSAKSSSTSEPAVKGGTLVLGAEQEPDCADWIASCAGATWGVYTMSQHTMPRVFNIKPDGNAVASDLVTGEPVLETGPPQKVTYKINPSAVWSDGQPITSTDFKYTWDQIANGSDIYDKTGYERIESVDDSDKATAVVTFKQPFADWKDLFGGFYGVFPSHLLQGKDRVAEMKDGYSWSGGPWFAKWTKGVQVELTPNPKYWGKKPNLDKVVFKFITDTSAELQAYKTGQVGAIYPQAQQETAQLKSAPNTFFGVKEGYSYEGIWLNASKPPLDSKAVRQALAYATDRDAIVKQLFGAVKPDIKAIESLTTPTNDKWYTEAFARYKASQAKVDELMQGDGWTKQGGVWTKNGQKATLTIKSTTGNKRRELMEQILDSQWKKAGFDVTAPDNQKAGTLFGELLPKGDYQMSIFAQTPTSSSPAQCVNFCSKNIPTDANGFSGTNWYRINDPSIDGPWDKADGELDQTARKKLVTDGYVALAEQMPMIPIDPFPNITIYNTAKLGGAISDNPIFGMFWNMNEWFCKGGKC
jgi:peptide/nickel transport system substrate-binding protein